MISYRFKRRAFLTAMSGGVGLKIMLRNMEAAAQTTKSPARLLVTHWPVGIVAGSGDALWKPTSGSVGGSPGLQPFVDNNLGADMTVIKGLSTPIGQGGSHEGGTPALVSGVAPLGTRNGEAESDDAYSSGPSFEQVMLGMVPALKAPNSAFTYANAGCDTRTDFGEISTKCLSYSTMQQTVSPALGPNPAKENIPNMPTLAPLTLYNNLFLNFVPTAYIDPGNGLAAAAPMADATLTSLASRRSVLDFAAQELNALRAMGPADTRMKLDNHYNAVLAMENNLTSTINTNYPPPTGTGGAGGTMGMAGMGGTTGGAGRGGAGGTTGAAGRGGSGGTTGTAGRGGTTGGAGTTGSAGTTGTGGTGGQVGCKTKPIAPPNVMGAMDPAKGLGNPYGATGNTYGATDDAANLQMVGAAHFSVLKAAFICDIIRCGTFLWAPGTNHAGFKLYPGTTTTYMHHPTSHKIGTGDTTAASTVAGLPRLEAQFLFAVQLWWFARTAENMKDWKSSIDGYGNSLLDNTVVPFVTEVLATGHDRNNMPAMIIGGKSLGYAHNIYKTGNASINSYWGTVAQAFGVTSFGAPLGTPISGLWTKPA